MMWEAPTEKERDEAELDFHCAGWKAAVRSRDIRIAALEAALEAKHQQYTGAVIQLTEERDNLIPRMLEWRGVETPCKRCGGSGRIGYANTATWRGGIGGSMMTADVCNGCWGTGDEHRKGVDLRKVSFEDTRALRVELTEARKELILRVAAMTRVHDLAASQLAEPAGISDSVALVRICTEIEAVRSTR